MSNVIRKATAADIPAILDITLEAFSKYSYDLNLPGKVAALRETEQSIQESLKKCTILVCCADGVPVGTVRYEELGPIAYLSRFAVKLSAQKCGVGRSLMQAVEADCIRKGIHAIALHTSSKMTALVRFYYGQGYYVHSTTTDRGYIRALLLRELIPDNPLNLTEVDKR